MEQDQEFYQNLADTIRWHRKSAGLTRQTLADYAGVGKTVIYDIEHAKPSVRLNTLVKICNTLNITIQLKSPLMDTIKDLDENR